MSGRNQYSVRLHHCPANRKNVRRAPALIMHMCQPISCLLSTKSRSIYRKPAVRVAAWHPDDVESQFQHQQTCVHDGSLCKYRRKTGIECGSGLDGIPKILSLEIHTQCMCLSFSNLGSVHNFLLHAIDHSSCPHIHCPASSVVEIHKISVIIREQIPGVNDCWPREHNLVVGELRRLQRGMSKSGMRN